MKTHKLSYLYKKTHNTTGLKYLGKTTQDPFKYQGSGTYWCNHINKHGNDVTTEILRECQTTEELKEWGIYYSNLWNIVESNEWANIRPESGDGGDTSMCENYIKGIVNRDMSGDKNPMWGVESSSKGKTYEEIYGNTKANELRMKRVASSTGRKLSKNSLLKMANSISESTKGVPKSEQHKRNMRKPKSESHKNNLRGPREKIECLHCGLFGGISQMKRWHFENCKNKEK